MFDPNKPVTFQYQGYQVTSRRAKSIGSGGYYYTAVAHKNGHQKLYAYGAWNNCARRIQDLIDEETRIYSLLRERLIQAQSVA
jgi:hypothetical protein